MHHLFIIRCTHKKPHMLTILCSKRALGKHLFSARCFRCTLDIRNKWEGREENSTVLHGIKQRRCALTVKPGRKLWKQLVIWDYLRGSMFPYNEDKWVNLRNTLAGVLCEGTTTSYKRHLVLFTPESTLFHFVRCQFKLIQHTEQSMPRNDTACLLNLLGS